MFNRVYVNNKHEIGFDCKGGTWLRAELVGDKTNFDGVYIDKAYMSCEPALSVKQARKFANKILGFCERIDND